MKRVTVHVHQFGKAFGTRESVSVSNQIDLIRRQLRSEPQAREVGTLPRDGVNNGGQARLEVSGDGGAESALAIEYEHGWPIAVFAVTRHAVTGHARA